MSFGAKLLLSLLTVVSCVLSQPPSALAAQVSISPQELAEQVALREDRVPEFKFIRETADRLGVRVWLFGGTASGYLHYVKWDMQRERGDMRFQADRFDYDFTNIYRSTQDLDIVADGSPDLLAKLAAELAAKYPHFFGSKARWEVRSLRQSSGSASGPGYKEALLNDFDFINQDTDSNSTGMVEITRRNGEAVVRDLRDWESADNHFLRDSAENRDTFYRSTTHFQTARAKAGQNPEIFSVIRALTKAFQYELSFSQQDWQEMQEIVDHFDPSSLRNQEAVRRLKDMGKKLFMHAVNLEYAWNVLEKMGLRQKLMKFDQKSEENSLAWWMNKEPLRSLPVGQGNGRTARALGLDVVAHETNHFLSYESITRAHTGDANVFTSRNGQVGESAAYGKGFYTQIGRQGAKGTGLTIRFHLHPDAREGTDFRLSETFVMIENKAAVSVIPESLNLSLPGYFRFLANAGGLSNADRGIYEKLSRRVGHMAQSLSADDFAEIKKIVFENPKSDAIRREYLDLLRSRADVKELFQYADRLSANSMYDFAVLKEISLVLNKIPQATAADIQEITALAEKGRDLLAVTKSPEPVEHLSSLVLWLLWDLRPSPSTMVGQFINCGRNDLVKFFFSEFKMKFDKPHDVELLEVAMKNEVLSKDVAAAIAFDPRWLQRSDIVKELMRRKAFSAEAMQAYIGHPLLKQDLETLELFFKVGQYYNDYWAGERGYNFLRGSPWEKNKEVKKILPWYRGVTSKNVAKAFRKGATFANETSEEQGMAHEASAYAYLTDVGGVYAGYYGRDVTVRLIENINRIDQVAPAEMQQILQLVQSKLQKALDSQSSESDLRVLEIWCGWKKSRQYPEIAQQILSSRNYQVQRAMLYYGTLDLKNPFQLQTLTGLVNQQDTMAFVQLEKNPEAVQRPDLLLKLMTGSNESQIRSILYQPQWGAHPEVLEAFYKRYYANPYAETYHLHQLLQQPHWKNNPAIKNILPWFTGKIVTPETLAIAFKMGRTLQPTVATPSAPAPAAAAAITGPSQLSTTEQKPATVQRGLRCETVFQ